jgi:hypothetical protein
MLYRISEGKDLNGVRLISPLSDIEYEVYEYDKYTQTFNLADIILLD